MNIGLFLPRNALQRPDETAVVFGDTRLTFREFNGRVNRLANALAGLGVGKGHKLATVLPNCLELLETYWAAAKMGAVVVPLSPLLRERAVAALIEDSDSETVITSPEFAEALATSAGDLWERQRARVIVTGTCYERLLKSASAAEPAAVAIGDNDVYNIIYSSGTTGTPKGIIHTHYIRALYSMLFASTWRMKPESVVLHSGSIIFNGAFLTLMPAMYLGAKYVLEKSFDPKATVEIVARERVTHMVMVPSQVVALLDSPYFSAEALGCLEMICSLGAPLHLEHKERLNRALPGRFYELYGLTEGFITVLDKNHGEAKRNSVGLPQPFFEMRIVDQEGKDLPAGEVGEILGRGPLLTPGYYKRPDLTEQAIVDGWLHTGDMGYADADGFLYLVDRKKDMIISGGVNVFPKDIEEVVVQHPAVQEAAVFGAPSAKWGETPVAAVILRDAEAVTAEELREWVNERVDAKSQRVSLVAIMEDFPRSTAGKTLKRVLREPYWAGQQEKI